MTKTKTITFLKLDENGDAVEDSGIVLRRDDVIENSVGKKISEQFQTFAIYKAFCEDGQGNRTGEFFAVASNIGLYAEKSSLGARMVADTLERGIWWGSDTADPVLKFPKRTI